MLIYQSLNVLALPITSISQAKITIFVVSSKIGKDQQFPMFLQCLKCLKLSQSLALFLLGTNILINITQVCSGNTWPSRDFLSSML